MTQLLNNFRTASLAARSSSADVRAAVTSQVADRGKSWPPPASCSPILSTSPRQYSLSVLQWAPLSLPTRLEAL